MYSPISRCSPLLYTASLPNRTMHAKNAGFPAVNDLASLFAFLSSFGALHDWIKLFLLGTVLETIRRFASQIWSSLIDSFFLTATFESDDAACEYIGLSLGYIYYVLVHRVLI